jgi:hypothetical protein
MKNTFIKYAFVASLLGVVALPFACKTQPKGSEPGPFASQQSFATPKDASDALIDAAASYDVPKLMAILGPGGKDLVASEDQVQDRNRAAAFVAKAREKETVDVDAKDSNRATLVVGNEDWPLPIPLVKDNGKWYFDSQAGHDEVLRRRIGANELDIINVCRGYVEAQQEYAQSTHDGAEVNQYAQRIISTPGKHDGLAWQNPDGTWGGPVGENVADAVEQGYAQGKPFHGYYFKILKGQGPAAKLGQLDYMVGGAMIGGFGLVAWPADYGVTGIQTFTVSYDGKVFQKDLGPDTEKLAPAMDRYNPDGSWKETDDEKD